MTKKEAKSYVNQDSTVFYMIPADRTIESYPTQVRDLLAQTGDFRAMDSEPYLTKFDDSDFKIQMNLLIFDAPKIKSRVKIRHTPQPNDLSAIPVPKQKEFGDLELLTAHISTNDIEEIRQIAENGFVIAPQPSVSVKENVR